MFSQLQLFSCQQCPVSSEEEKVVMVSVPLRSLNPVIMAVVIIVSSLCLICEHLVLTGKNKN